MENFREKQKNYEKWMEESERHSNPSVIYGNILRDGIGDGVYFDMKSNRLYMTLRSEKVDFNIRDEKTLKFCKEMKSFMESMILFIETNE